MFSDRATQEHVWEGKDSEVHEHVVPPCTDLAHGGLELVHGQRGLSSAMEHRMAIRTDRVKVP